MDDVKLGAGEGRKAAAADGAPRRPLVPSEKGNAGTPGGGRRREATSRFKPAASPAPAPAAAAAVRRCTSPSPGRVSAGADGTASCNRARSADRARPASTSTAPSSQLKPSAAAAAAAAARSATPARDAVAEARGAPRGMSAKAPDGLWASARSSSPAPRSESVPAPAKKIDRLVRGLPSEVAKVKVQADAAPERKRSPVRRSSIGNQCENARPSESPATAKRVVEQHRWPAMTGGQGSAGLTSASIAPAAGNASRSASSSNPSPAGHSPMRMRPSEGTVKCLSPSNEMAKRAAIRRSRRDDKADQDSDASSQTSEGSKSACRPSRAISVPILHRSSSPTPSKVVTAASSYSKASQSPSRIRPSAPCRSKCASSAAQPVFNYIVDARKGKKAANQIENIHQLRMLDNRYLQWRFVNAISEATQSFRRNNAESTIFNVSQSILTLQDALTTTRIDVRLLQQEMKLHDIVTKQITYLEQWPELEEENSSTLAEAIEALKASTLRLPVTSGAQAETVAVKNAVSSAVDVMQALSSSICYLQSKVEDRTSLVSELSVMARQERAALDECRQLLATAAKLQVQESSLRTHLVQLREDSG